MKATFLTFIDYLELNSAKNLMLLSASKIKALRSKAFIKCRLDRGNVEPNMG